MTKEKGPTMSRIIKLAATTAAAALLCLSPGAMSVAAEDDAKIYHDAMFRHWGLNPAAFPVGSYNSGEVTVAAPEPAVPAPAPAPDLGQLRNDVGPAPAPVDPNRMRNDIGLGNLDPVPAPAPADVGAARNGIGDYGLTPNTPVIPVDAGMEPGEIVGWAALGVAAASATIAGLIVVRRRHDESSHLPHAA
jgi:hypothetical protein